MNIYQKLIEVRKTVEYLQKEKSGNQYKYVGSSQVLSALRKKMDELGLLLIPRVTGHNVIAETVEFEDKGRPKKQSTYFTELDMTMTWVNAEKPEETIECPWYGQGVDIAGEKGVGKALTYAEKYFMLKFFNIATDKDDPDSFQQEPTKKNGQNPPKNEVQGGSNQNQGSISLKLSQRQMNRLWAIAKQSGYSEELVKKAILKLFGDMFKITAEMARGELDMLLMTEMDKKQYDKLVDTIQKNPAK